MPLVPRGSGIGFFEKAHFELGPEQSGYCGVDDRNIQLLRLDKLCDFLEIAVLELTQPQRGFDRGLFLQGSASHLDVNTSRQQLFGDRFHVDRVTPAHLEGAAESITSTRISHDKIVVAPFLPQDSRESVVVGDCRNSIVSVNPGLASINSRHYPEIISRVICRHDCPCAGIHDGSLE